jgi:hypothetical protein
VTVEQNYARPKSASNRPVAHRARRAGDDDPPAALP